ncbi:MAG: hypothetical protein AB7L91_15745 [Dehalococcoidia bacterium]
MIEVDGAPSGASARVVERNRYVLEGRFREQIVKAGELLDGLLHAVPPSDLLT